MKHPPRNRNSPARRHYERLNLAKVDDESLQRAEAQAETQHHRGRRERVPSDDVEIRHHDADEADHRTDREINAAGQDDEGRPDRGDDDESVVGQDVAEDERRQEIIVQHPAGYEEGQEDNDRGEKRQILLVHRFLRPKLAYRALRRLSDCSKRTMMTTTALTTRLYSGGKPLVRMDVVSV